MADQKNQNQGMQDSQSNRNPQSKQSSQNPSSENLKNRDKNRDEERKGSSSDLERKKNATGTRSEELENPEARNRTSAPGEELRDEEDEDTNDQLRDSERL